MCIIVAKEKNKRIPTIDELTNCFKNNDDGAGFMYVDNGEVVIDKGYMRLSDFLNRYKELCRKYNDFKDKALVIHCRIGTSSGNTAQNTHPYPISGDEKILHKLKLKTGIGIAHNGIIHDYTPLGVKPTTNDTQEFIKNYIEPLHANYRDFYKNDYIMRGINKITNSKFVILDNKDNLYYVGDFVEDKGLKFSNTTYTYYYYSHTNYGTPYKYAYDWYNESEHDDYDSLDYPVVPADDYKSEEELYEHLLFLDKDWFISDFSGMNYEMVGERSLWYNYYTTDLYEMNSAGELILIRKNALVVDENGEEII